jgi:hypothetical protein
MPFGTKTHEIGEGPKLREIFPGGFVVDNSYDGVYSYWGDPERPLCAVIEGNRYNMASDKSAAQYNNPENPTAIVVGGRSYPITPVIG